ncbi:MAG TPA: hypothetical protein VHT96_16090 [Clostridia bacterium]|nr:hypothetical protein [Clostridia bacterium]
MEASKIEFAAGMQVIMMKDSLGRDTEICIGHRDIMIIHKAFDGSVESMRRYPRNETNELSKLLGDDL